MLIFHTDASFFCLKTDSPAWLQPGTGPGLVKTAEVNDILHHTKDRKDDHIAAPVTKIKKRPPFRRLIVSFYSLLFRHIGMD
ncbi:hypothetical protein P9C02_11695 [Bacillus paralicheniformis]|uniref:hypothetical protein n=1 Tax=Bacillus paralicheniformis TaxID=1648923 RepID=UPI002DBCE65E|nr:hypothetical protein [Bacillus paralicheniformis]MEC1191170.1 hypothetical protein [Bacillus paralicheniformis]MEC1298197.1 hypothetical protein [Bacillus paralicheniformis]